MAASSSGSRTDDVFPSFRGEDVRDAFLSHLLNALHRKSISTFIDNGIERSCEIGPALLSAIREAKISIVIFSKNYASSKWCLDELVEIHECYMRSSQKVIPIFYNVDPSEVRNQTGEFKKVFEETCNDKTEDRKQNWKQALTDVANLAGEHLKKGVDEARVVEKIANDVANKLIIYPSNYSDNLVGMEVHIEEMKSRLYLESVEVRMVGIVGSSGMGKSTIGRELYNQISRQFPYRVYSTYRKTNQDNCAMRLDWAKQFLSDILGQKDIEVVGLGDVEQRLKDKKVLIVLDDVDNLELLETLVRETKWFGPGSRIIVITQDKHLLKAHGIDLDRVYEVELPSKTLALEMLCRSAFKHNTPPDGFMEVATEVAKLAGNLPLALSVFGSSLKGREKEDWIDMLSTLKDILDGDIGKRLKVNYDRLDKEDQVLFLYVACRFNGRTVERIQEYLGERVKIRLKRLAEKSLIRITPFERVEMHDLLKMLAREIFLAESNPGKRPFLVDVDDIRRVLTNNTGTDTVHGIIFCPSLDDEKFSVHENSFESMYNIQMICICDYPNIYINLPQGLVSLPRQLRVLRWDYYPAKCLPTFKTEFLVRLYMRGSNLVKLWDGTLPLGNLKVMDMSDSEYLEEIPDLSNAINLFELHLSYCTSLVTLPTSIQNLTKLFNLNMEGCEKLENIPTILNLESLAFFNVDYCEQLRNFPMISLSEFDYIRVECCLWSRNLPGLIFLDCLMKFIPRQYRLQHFRRISVSNSMIEKLWEGVQSFENLKELNLSECDYLKEIPDLSKATNLWTLKFSKCKSLLVVPSTIGNLQKLEELDMSYCRELKVLPINVNLSSLRILNFSGCSRLSMFPKISSSIEELYLNGTAIEGVPYFIENFWRLWILKMCGCERLKVLPMDVNLPSLRELDFSGCSTLSMFPKISNNIEMLYLNETAIEGVPCFIENFSRLWILAMRGCKRLKNISSNIFRLKNHVKVDFANCVDVITVLSDVSEVTTTEDNFSAISESRWWFNEYINFENCFKLDEDAREFILRSCCKPTILPGGEVPAYFKHRAFGNFLIVTLPQSLLSQDTLQFKACVVFEASFQCPNGLDFNVDYLFNGKSYKAFSYVYTMLSCEKDHLVMCSFVIKPKDLPFKLGFNDMEFKFESAKKIKECGMRLLNVFLSPDGSYETTYNQQSADKRDVVETGGSMMRMRMELGTSTENCNSPCDQNVLDESLELTMWPKRSG